MNAAFRRPTLLVSLGASVVFHGLVAFALWESQFRTEPATESVSSRIAITLVSNAATQSIDEPLVVPPVAPVLPPPPVAGVPRPKVKPPVESLSKKPPVIRPAAMASPALPEVSPPAEVLPDTLSDEISSPNASTSALAAVEASDAVAREQIAAGTIPAREAEARPDAMPSYVAEVRRRIESKKRYPAMARRRREEGRVLARVSISSNGALRGLDLEEKAPLSLRRATRSAIQGAAPFPVPPRGEVMVEISVVWQVRR